jgi:N-acetylglucosamine kinase-like BadF-type ATPase
LAGLAPLVLEAADGGDVVAAGLADEGARELALAAAAVAHRIGLDGGEMPVALAGGVFLASASFRGRFQTALTSHGVTASPVTLVPEPARGAVRLALGNI